MTLNRPHHKRRAQIVAIVALTACVLTIASRPTPPSLQLYTSPIVTIPGSATQVQLLIPFGWVADPVKPPGQIYVGRAMILAPSISIHPARKWKWAPRWLVGRIFPEPEAGAEIVLTFDRGRHEDDETHQFTIHVNGVELNVANRELQERRGYGIHYLRSDREQFNATFREVCDSFKVIQ